MHSNSVNMAQRLVTQMVISIVMFRDELSSDSKSASLLVGPEDMLRHKIHPCERWTTGGFLVCISAMAAAINSWADNKWSGWTLLVTMPVCSFIQVKLE